MPTVDHEEDTSTSALPLADVPAVPKTTKPSTPTRVMYLQTRHGSHGVLQLHQAGWANIVDSCFMFVNLLDDLVSLAAGGN